MIERPRRLRRTPLIRELVAETRLRKDMFVYPYFIVPGTNVQEPIAAMPGIYHFSTDLLLRDVEHALRLGLNKFLLFGVGEDKKEDASSSYAGDSVVAQAISALRDAFGDDILIITDVCTCAYTTHGHCGIIRNGYVQNDETVDILAKMALAHAQAGADMVAPSDMMDGRIAGIRERLDANGFSETAIMSYSVKFASAYYGPFREAADSAPAHGDRKSYQMDFRNARESLKEARLDMQESADILMVKPALAYMDVIKSLRQTSDLPIACYNVSGEYSMVKAAAAAGWIDERKIVVENMYGFARAGADIIISYHARDLAENNWIDLQ